MVQGSILALAGIISKIIGFIYRIPMANYMGNTGNGLYSVAFGIYNVALTLSSYSMPLAVSKLVSERRAKKEYKNSHRLFLHALFLAVLSGLAACLVLYFGAEQLAEIYQKPGLERPLRVLAPTTFIVALLGTCRGYFQGQKNMVPTAVSQVVEQLINAIVSVVATAVFVASCPLVEQQASYGAMGGTCGTLAGAGTALLIFVGLFVAKRKGIREELGGKDEATEESALLCKAILLTVFPIIISQTIYQLGYTIDDYIFGNLMAYRGANVVETTNLQGVFHTQYNQLVNLPVAIATAMAAATLPSIVASYSVGDKSRIKEKINLVLKLNMLIAIPSAVGLAVLADPIMYLLFPTLRQYQLVATRLLLTGSSAVIFYALSTLSTSVLQGCNHMRKPVVHAGISLTVHILLLTVLLRFTDLGVYALIIGNVTFPLMTCFLNLRSLRKLLDYHLEWKNTFLGPLLSAGIMGVIAYGIYQMVLVLCPASWNELSARLLGLILAVVLAVLVYAVCLLKFRVLSKEELQAMPVIGKLLRKRSARS